MTPADEEEAVFDEAAVSTHSGCNGGIQPTPFTFGVSVAGSADLGYGSVRSDDMNTVTTVTDSSQQRPADYIDDMVLDISLLQQNDDGYVETERIISTKRDFFIEGNEDQVDFSLEKAKNKLVRKIKKCLKSKKRLKKLKH